MTYWVRKSILDSPLNKKGQISKSNCDSKFSKISLSTNNADHDFKNWFYEIYLELELLLEPRLNKNK